MGRYDFHQQMPRVSNLEVAAGVANAAAGAIDDAFNRKKEKERYDAEQQQINTRIKLDERRVAVAEGDAERDAITQGFDPNARPGAAAPPAAAAGGAAAAGASAIDTVRSNLAGIGIPEVPGGKGPAGQEKTGTYYDYNRSAAAQGNVQQSGLRREETAAELGQREQITISAEDRARAEAERLRGRTVDHLTVAGVGRNKAEVFGDVGSDGYRAVFPKETDPEIIEATNAIDRQRQANELAQIAARGAQDRMTDAARPRVGADPANDPAYKERYTSTMNRIEEHVKRMGRPVGAIEQGVAEAIARGAKPEAILREAEMDVNSQKMTQEQFQDLQEMVRHATGFTAPPAPTTRGGKPIGRISPPIHRPPIF